jgi:hypothetical protein
VYKYMNSFRHLVTVTDLELAVLVTFNGNLTMEEEEVQS